MIAGPVSGPGRRAWHMNDMKRRFKLAVRRKLSEYSDNTYFAYVNGLEQPDLSSTILVEIPAYHDPLLMWTIHNALNAAANPDRIHFAVCHQGDDDEALEALGRVRNCRVTHFAEKDVPGSAQPGMKPTGCMAASVM